MNKLIIPLALGLLCTSFTVIPAPPGDSIVTGIPENLSGTKSPIANTEEAITNLYCTGNLDQYGLSREAFEYAWKGYRHLLDKKMISRTAYLTVCDFSQPSSKKRLYIIDVEKGVLLNNTYVAHGKNSGSEYATQFSNTPESLQSSLGFYITENTYMGEHGLSLRINGVDPGFNDKAMERSIVIHGAAYVDGARARAGVFMGRSFGCPAVPQQESAKIIGTIKNGTCLFIYHPSKKYLQRSKILND
jgi:L,D-transpeptidase catalytic domain